MQTSISGGFVLIVTGIEFGIAFETKNMKMIKKFSFLASILFVLAFQTNAQPSNKANIGFGMGIDYGGFGSRVSYLPIDKIGLFGSVGYNLNSVGYNLGAQLRFPSKKSITFYFTGMYGYNAVVIVKQLESKTTYYGLSAGTGLEFNFKNKKSFLSTELLVPFRPKAYHNGVNALKSIGYQVKAFPIAISIGYHIKF